MLIKFDEMEITMLEKFYGGEKSVEARMFVDERNRIMCSRLSLEHLLDIINMKMEVK